MIKPSFVCAALCLVGCGDNYQPIVDDDPDALLPDAALAPDADDNACDPALVLPTQYRPIATVSTGGVELAADAGVMTGFVDATAGGLGGSADNPYVYVNLVTGQKVAVDDLAARSSSQWDLAFKRSSVRVNGGDSGPGNRQVAIVEAPDLASVTAPPTEGFAVDDFTSATCTLEILDGGEPQSSVGMWYEYNLDTHQLGPKPEVYVIKRNNGSHTAVRILTYYGDPSSTMRGAYYRIEYKQL